MGADGALVSPPVFKTVREARDVSGGFDSHTFPPMVEENAGIPQIPAFPFFPRLKLQGTGMVLEESSSVVAEKPGGGYDPGGVPVVQVHTGSHP